jgi:hypothetical protein
MDLSKVTNLNELKELLKRTVDELLNLRNRLAEYDSEFISKFDDLELNMNRLFHLQGEEKDLLTKKMLFDCERFKGRVEGVAEELSGQIAHFRRGYNESNRINTEKSEGCSTDLKTNVTMLIEIYREHIGIFSGMELIYKRYIKTLEDKLSKLKA